MVKHILDEEKCRGCGKCVDVCSLELWELEDTADGKKIAVVIEEADEICRSCRLGIRRRFTLRPRRLRANQTTSYRWLPALGRRPCPRRSRCLI